MVLTGDGGDEVLSGYPTYLGLKYSEFIKKLPSFLKSGIPITGRIVAPLLKGKVRYLLNRGINFVYASSLPFENWIVLKSTWADFKIIKSLKAFPVEDYFSDLLKNCSYKDNFYKLMFVHFKHDLPNDFLVKVDRMSLAYSLEARLPFLDHRLIEFMVQVDKNVKIQGQEQKSILRNTVGKKLPVSLLKAPKKGFAVPLREWFKNKDDIPDLATLCSEDFGLDRPLIERIIDQNRSGKKDYGNFIWQLFVLKNTIQNSGVK
jgi:asparagine synthase (glutamine-hydrolysing)